MMKHFQNRPQHTPGPWFYNGDEGGFCGHVISVGDGEIADIADWPNPKRTIANARLIAQAPAMKDCLTAGIENTRRVVMHWSRGNLAEAVNALEAWAEDARHLLSEIR